MNNKPKKKQECANKTKLDLSSEECVLRFTDETVEKVKAVSSDCPYNYLMDQKNESEKHEQEQ